MGITISFLVFTISLIIIIKGGDWFVDSATAVAQITGIPNILIGATIVSVATTLPELLVSSIATYNQYYDIAIGNVVGSIICNIGLILGLVAILSPVKINRKSFSIKGGFMLLSCIILFILLQDTIITGREGNLLLVLFVVYIFLNIIELKSKPQTGPVDHEFKRCDSRGIFKIVAKFIIGAMLIVIGAKLMVESGVKIARFLKVPEQFISLTLIALGTSLPELVTAISSILKRQEGISIGNILGANILDMLMVLGVSSKIGGKGIIISYQNIMFGARIYNIPQTLYLDLPVALFLMSVLVIGGMVSKKIGRILGISLLFIYLTYLTALTKLFL
ncbi:MAG: calcium/sodium antiporter [Candidatus Alkaliphilus sp. MAG34]|nr:calcium/sodium antiporter [Clostridiales bacterium]